MTASYFLDVAFRIDHACRTGDAAAYARALAKVRADGHHQLADRIDLEMRQTGLAPGNAVDQEKQL
jgi:hypothetical protein